MEEAYRSAGSWGVWIGPTVEGQFDQHLVAVTLSRSSDPDRQAAGDCPVTGYGNDLVTAGHPSGGSCGIASIEAEKQFAVLQTATDCRPRRLLNSS